MSFVFCWPQPVGAKHGAEKVAFSTITHYIFTPLPWVFLFSSQPCILTRCVKFRQPQALNDSSPSHSLSAAYWSCVVSTFRLWLLKMSMAFTSGPGRDGSSVDGLWQIKMLRLSRPSSIWEQSKYTINHMHTGLGDKFSYRYYSNSFSPPDSFLLLQGDSVSIFSLIFYLLVWFFCILWLGLSVLYICHLAVHPGREVTPLLPIKSFDLMVVFPCLSVLSTSQIVKPPEGLCFVTLGCINQSQLIKLFMLPTMSWQF